jgi:hypothetical protein
MKLIKRFQQSVHLQMIKHTFSPKLYWKLIAQQQHHSTTRCVMRAQKKIGSTEKSE